MQIFCSAPTHYKKMLILSGVMHRKVLHFFVVCQCITKNELQKYVVHSINHMLNFRWEIVFNNFLNLLEILEFLGDTEL